MTGTWRALRAEWYRLSRSRVAASAAVFLALVAVARVFAARVAERTTYVEEVQRALRQGRPAPPVPPLGNAWPAFVDGWLTALTVGTLLLLIFSARTLASDRESGLLRVARTRSVSRGGLVLGRVLLGLALVLGTLAVTGLGAWVAASIWFEFGPVTESGYELVGSSELRRELIAALLATLPPLLATWCFGLLISSLARSGAGAVSGALALYLGFDLFKDILGSRQYLVFASFNPSFVDNSCLKELSGIARGYSDAGYSETLYAQNLWLPWPWAVAMLLLAVWIMRRRAL
jgi:ABC-type transport system involved in multi-copper enzyme maturation permease subunit